MRRVLPLLLLAPTLVPSPTPLGAQAEISARSGTLRIGGRLHAQYAASSVPEATNEFFFRRVRLTADITLSDFVSARVQPDFAGGKTALQDTYVRLNFSDRFRLYMGQFKRSFDLFELASSTDLSLIERDGRVAGVSHCRGVGGICSYSRLTEKLELAGRDQGLKVDGEEGRWAWEATVTNGTGINTSDENDAKSVSGRLTLAARENVRVSGQLARHDYLDEAKENRGALAFGGDVEIGTWRDGLLVQAAVVAGDNWAAADAAGDPLSFLTFQGVVSYYHPLEGRARVVGVEPLARVSFGDPDTATDSDGGTLFTPGFMLYFQGRSKLGFNLDVYAPATGDTDFSFKVQSFLYF